MIFLERRGHPMKPLGIECTKELAKTNSVPEQEVHESKIGSERAQEDLIWGYHRVSPGIKILHKS